MNYAYLREILQAQWMIEPYMASMYQKAFRGALMGLQIERDETPVAYYQDAVTYKKAYHKEDLPSGKAINVVNLKGIMTKEDGDCHDGTRTIASRLTNNDKEDFIIGHVLVINSGGGAGNSVQCLAEAIKGCTKPVVAFVDGLMASAAMYAGSYCPYIIADSENDRIGCIGTMIEIVDYPKQAQMDNGLISVRVYATKSTEKNLDYEEALAGNVELIRKDLLDPLNDQFLAAMRENRNVTDDLLTGRTYFAKNVVGTLIDEIGHMDRAFEKVKELAGFTGKAEVTEDDNSNKPINNMKFDRINQIEGCEAVETTEGAAQVTEVQLTNIEAKLSADAQTIADRDNTIQSVNDKLTQAQQQITTLTDTVKQREDRITALESIIEAKNNGIEDQHHNGKQTDDDGSHYECKDPMAACLEHINKFKH